VIAITCGKTSRRCHARSKGRGPLHTVSAWATGQRLVLGQEAVSEKSNEITAIPLLLQRLKLAGALVAIDAMGTQTAIAQTILDGGGDYVLVLKQNQPMRQGHGAVRLAADGDGDRHVSDRGERAWPARSPHAPRVP